MNYEQYKKRLQRITKKKNLTRDDLEFVLDHIAGQVTIESFSRILDVKEELGFARRIEN